ncbi:MAG: histidinol dehydrogenase [Planctomycetaceae bacterium]
MLITWHPPLIAVRQELEAQCARLSGRLAVRLEDYGALILARDSDEAAQFADELAPEHLHISADNPERLLARIQNAGAIFLGHMTPVVRGRLRRRACRTSCRPAALRGLPTACA